MGNKSKNIEKNKTSVEPKVAVKPMQEEIYEGKIAVCKMDNQIDDLVKFNTFHNTHKKLLKLLLSSFLVFIGGMLALTQNSTELAIVFFIATPLFPVVLVLIQRASLRAQLQKDFEFAKTSHSYEFSEEAFFAITKCGKRVASAKIEYNKLDKCYDTPQCFYIYISQGNAFVLKKEKFVYGDMNNFKLFLKEKLGKKYKVTLKQAIYDKKKGGIRVGE